MNNILALYKPKGPTSHDIVDEIRRITGVKKVGHAGTLDPLASGVLVIGIGREATKKLSHIVAKEKEYLARIKLGEVSETDDEEGIKKHHITNPFDQENSKFQIPHLKAVEAVLRSYIGKIMQRPPVYSALKIKGKSAYKYARSGKNVKLPPREVEIKEIEVLKYEWPFLELRVVTGAGVYIRSLARNIGERLGVGGYLAELERTRVGEFMRENTTTLSDLQKQYYNQ